MSHGTSHTSEVSMAASHGGIRFICPTYVKPERVQEFEAFVDDVLAPAVQRYHPELVDDYTMQRPATDAPEGAQDAYVLLFYGDHPWEAWDVKALLTEAHGAEEAERLDKQFEDMMAGEQLVFVPGETVYG